MSRAEDRPLVGVDRAMSRAVVLAVLLAGCRAAARAPAARAEVPSAPAESVPAPAAGLADSAIVVEVVPIQYLRAEVLAPALGPRSERPEPPRWNRWNETRYCVLMLPWTPVITDPDTSSWRAKPRRTVDVDAGSNAIVIRGTAAKVAELRALALRLDHLVLEWSVFDPDSGASRPRAP